MKKKMFMMLCLAILGIQVSKAQQSIIALHHEGNVTIFAGSKTQEAMDASVKGDTLYLSEGTFAGFNVTHGIVVLGSGERTILSGDVTITGNDEKKDLGGYVFGGLNLLHDFVVNDSVNGLRISQCQMNNFTVKDGIHLETGEMVMSNVRNIMWISKNIQGFDVINSEIRGIHYYSYGGDQGVVNFTHCNIGWHENAENVTGIGKTTYVNCTNHEICSGTYIKCIYSSIWSQANKNNIKLTSCYYVPGYKNDKDSLTAAGYLGNDGTVVGITGGECPFTLELATPHIVDHKVDVDNVNRKLTVTLKMAHEATKEDE